jgi:hypothetical protein
MTVVISSGLSVAELKAAIARLKKVAESAVLLPGWQTRYHRLGAGVSTRDRDVRDLALAALEKSEDLGVAAIHIIPKL